jgi:hypothetical protein
MALMLMVVKDLHPEAFAAALQEAKRIETEATKGKDTFDR